jgi:hypothetical protein
MMGARLTAVSAGARDRTTGSPRDAFKFSGRFFQIKGEGGPIAKEAGFTEAEG